jgi:hypothetical protein
MSVIKSKNLEMLKKSIIFTEKIFRSGNYSGNNSEHAACKKMLQQIIKPKEKQRMNKSNVHSINNCITGGQVND